MDLVDVSFEADCKRQPSLLFVERLQLREHFSAELSLVVSQALFSLALKPAGHVQRNAPAAGHVDDNVQVECEKPAQAVDLGQCDFRCDDQTHVHATHVQTDAGSTGS